MTKRHPLLSDISASLAGRLPTGTVEVLSHRYTIQVLKPEGEDWVASKTTGTTIASFAVSARKPLIAAALTAIDDVPIAQLFVPEGEAEGLLSNAELLRDWRRQQLLDWLSNDSDSFVLDQIHAFYTKLVSEHRESLKEMENLSKRTPPGS